jgi:hypothetical protein
MSLYYPLSGETVGVHTQASIAPMGSAGVNNGPCGEIDGAKNETKTVFVLKDAHQKLL